MSLLALPDVKADEGEPARSLRSFPTRASALLAFFNEHGDLRLPRTL